MTKRTVKALEDALQTLESLTKGAARPSAEKLALIGALGALRDGVREIAAFRDAIGEDYVPEDLQHVKAMFASLPEGADLPPSSRTMWGEYDRLTTKVGDDPTLAEALRIFRTTIREVEKIRG